MRCLKCNGGMAQLTPGFLTCLDCGELVKLLICDGCGEEVDNLFKIKFWDGSCLMACRDCAFAAEQSGDAEGENNG
jgi:hypothetical protein